MCQKYIIGSKKPIAELVVAPKKAITVLMFVSRRAIAILTIRITSVQTAFIVPENFFPIISSIESLVGKTVKGVAKSTTKQIPKSDTYMTKGVLPESGSL